MKTFLILLLGLGALLLIPSFGTVYGPPIDDGITIWVGTGDGQSWSDPNNWDRQVGFEADTIGFNHMVPELCDLVIIDANTANAATVHFDISYFQLGNEMQIGSDDTFVIDSGNTFDHTPDRSCPTLNAAAETIVNAGNFNVFGTLLNNGAFINIGAVLDCGIISGNVLPIQGIVNRCAVGGEMIPLDTTMVLLAGSQMTASWMIPIIVSGIGIGIVLARKF
jgi:hypothetical protein